MYGPMPDGLSPAELAAVYAQYAHLMRRRARILLRSEALADDALQEAFVKLLRYGADFRRAEAPLRWLYRVVDRACFDQLARVKSRAETDEMPPELGVAPGALRVDERDVVMRFLGHLGEEDRTIAVLAFVDGLSQGEIAEETGVSRQTVNKKVQAIRQRS